jgi:hypothetical protein
VLPDGVRTRVLQLTDPSRVTDPTPQDAGADAQPGRSLPTTLYYPTTGAGPFPVVVFSHGMDALPTGYGYLLSAWAEAGFVVAAPQFPLTSHGSALVQEDILQQPADVSFVLTAVLALNDTAGDDPKSTALAFLKPVPARTTCAPPVAGADFGVIDVMVARFPNDQTAPIPPSCLGAPTKALLPSAASATLVPNAPAPTSPPASIFLAPSWSQFVPERTYAHIAPRPPVSPGPPRSTVSPSAESATLAPSWAPGVVSSGANPRWFFHVPGRLLSSLCTNAHAYPLPKPGAPTTAVSPSADIATLSPNPMGPGFWTGENRYFVVC